jgi:S-DNA-T family DNA segregation ATPase FtsK/SpoIIIE
LSIQPRLFARNSRHAGIPGEAKKIRLKGDRRIVEEIEAWAMRPSPRDGSESEIAMDDDPKWDEALNIARTHGVVSASFLQRHLKIGYNRAARIVEFMESKGLVDKADGAKPRKWLGTI